MDQLSKGLRILSFDGGGVYGLSELLILLEIMKRIAFDLGEDCVRPRYYFEMTGGSGTGALNAILLGRLGFTVEETIDHYIQITEIVYSTKEMTSSERVIQLRAALEKVVVAAGLEADAKMATDSTASACKTLIFVASVDNPGSPRRFRSYRARAYEEYNCTIVEAALAALAIPGILPSISIGEVGRTQAFMEASFGCNNPTMELLREAEVLFKKKLKLSTLISLGAGRGAVSTLQNRDGVAGEVVKTMGHMDSHIELSSEQIHAEVRQRTDYMNAYFRFEQSRDLDPTLALEQKISAIQAYTIKYLQEEDVNEQIDDVVELLQSPGEGTAFSMKPKEAARLAVDEQMKSQLEPSLDAQVLLLQKSASAEGTLHDKCLPGTRVAVLQEIRDWAISTTPTKPIFWLCDSAGTGKSTVAATMSNEWAEDQQLGGRFFFNSSDTSTSSTKLFCSTLALDIAAKIPGLRSRIAAAFKEDALLSNREFTEQFRKLISEPLLSLERNMIIVIDAVDECDIPSRKQLLTLLVQQLPSIPRLKIFITSRPEDDIYSFLKEVSIVREMEFVLQTTMIRSNVEDIQKYIEFHLGGVLSEAERLLLVEKAGGLFIWASTAKRELDPGSSKLPNKRIFQRLVSSPVTRDLNSLYSGILQRAFPNAESIEFGCQALGIVAVSQEPISMITLTRFMSGESVKKVVDSLRSVLNYTNDNDLIHFFHPTFREYLLSCKSGPFIIDLEKAHLNLARECFSVMLEELEENICDVSSTDGIYPSNQDIPNRIHQVISSTSAALRYSIIYWFVHTKACTNNEAVLQSAIIFFETNLLNWTEILSLIGQVQAGLNGLNTMKNLGRSLGSQATYLRVLNWCNDAIRLIQSRLADIEENAFKIYSTVLSLAPRQSLVYKTYGPAFKRYHPRLLAGQPEVWPTHEILSGHTDAIISISVHGEKIVSGSLDKTLRLWNSRTGTGISDPLSGHTGGVTCVAFSPDGTRVLSGSSDNTIILWDSATGKPLGEPLKGHEKSINDFAISPDGLRLVSASNDKTLRLWDLSNPTFDPIVIKGHTGAVSSVVFSPNGAVIASGSWDETVRLWSGITGEGIGDTLGGHTLVVNCVVFSPDGNLLASASSNVTIRIWNVEMQKCIRDLRGHTRWVSCLSWSSDGIRIVSGSWDKSIRLWNVSTGECITQLNGHRQSLRCVEFLPEENRIVSGSYDHTIRIWDLDVQQGAVEDTPNVHSEFIAGIAFSPCGSKVATSSDDWTLRLWDVLTGDVIGEMKGHRGGVYCFAFSPSGETIVSSSPESLRLWEVNSQNCLEVLSGHTNLASSVAFSYDGTKIISGGYSGALSLWDSKLGTQVGNLFEGDPGSINCVAFSPDDTMIVSGSYHGTLRLWSITGKELFYYREGSPIHLAVISTDNLHVLSASDRDIVIWNISSSNSIARFPHDQSSPLPSHIQSLEFDLSTSLVSDGRDQSSAVIESIQHYFGGDHHSPQISYKQKSRTISSSHSSNYAFPLPVDLQIYKWKHYNGILVMGGRDGRVLILDFNHLFNS